MKFKGKLSVVLSMSLASVFVVQNGASAAMANMQYRLLESFPGFYSQGAIVSDLPAFIGAIYKFGIWTVGIAGLFMLVIGGFMYMASAGNTSVAGTAKGIIYDAILGIVAALSAYLIMYVINPDLTKINIAFAPVGLSAFGGPSGSGNPNPMSGTCVSDTMLAKIKAATPGGMDPCLVFALLNTESACIPNATSSAGACGIAQILPTTAGMTCQQLNADPDTSIAKGVQLLSVSMGSGKLRGDIHGAGNAFTEAVMDLYASYNGGMGALAPSNDCINPPTNELGFPYVKWDCKINPRGYTETQGATVRYLASYNACKKEPTLQEKLK